MGTARCFADGLSRPAVELHPYELLGTVCTRGGVQCPLIPGPRAEEFLARVKDDPTLAIRLISEADEVVHYSAAMPPSGQEPEGRGREAATPQILNRKRDLDILQRLGLCPGDTRRARYLYTLLFERIATPYGICAYHTPGWEGCELARSGAYERIRAQGWSAITHCRSQQDKDEFRRQSAERIAHGDRLYVRPHHIMCMACWWAGGEGQGPRPEDTIYELHQRIRQDPDVPLVLVEGCCEACWCCDGYDPATTRCVHNGGLIRDYKKDLDVFQMLGLMPGDTMPARQFVKLMFERIPSTRQVCGYGDGIVRAHEWEVCGGPHGHPGYVKSRDKGLL